MPELDVVKEAWREAFRLINADIYNFTTVKPDVDEWIAEHMWLPASTTGHPGQYNFDFTPYMRRWVKLVHPGDTTRFASIMKDGQSGFTTALVIGCMLYIISENPDSILFTAADVNLAKKTIEERFDPVIRASKLDHLIRPNAVKKTNNRTGDTSTKKEFANGTMTIAGTNSANTFRMFSAKTIFNDDWDTAPKEVGKEGSPKMVMKTRQNSYGDSAKTIMISTPTVTQTSNIYEQFLLGTQEYWNWPCPHCGEFFPVLWQVEMADGTFGGIVWELDEHNKLKPETVHYKCQLCGGKIEEKQKYDLNLLGDWIATVPVPAEKNHVSGIKNFIYNPPGFEGWVTGVEEWLAACPPGGQVDVLKLKTFNNLRLGMPFAEMGDAPRVNELMKNQRGYLPGIVPDLTCAADGNGQILLLTMACDINGFYKPGENEDVRLDWEVLAHASSGATYSVDHGSIGTFQRSRDRTKKDKEHEADRDKWTLTANVKNSVWDEVEVLMRKSWVLESATTSAPSPAPSKSPPVGETLEAISGRQVTLTLIDTGHGEKAATGFIARMQLDGMFCFGVKGRVEDYRPLKRDANPVRRSTERPKELYIADVHQMKDDLAQYMSLRAGEDGSQPGGFMNFPQSRDGKYEMKSYFVEFEGERRIAEKKNNEIVGYKWVKKNSNARNHFWDVRIYNLCAREVFLDLLRRSETKYKNCTWEDFVLDAGG